MIRLLVTLALLMPSLGQADAQTLTYDSNKLKLEQGVYCKQKTVDTLAAPDTEAGEINLFEHTPDFLARTNRVPAILGIGFGIKAETLDGTFYDPVLITVTHPPFHGTGTTRQSYLSTLGDGGSSITAYSFDIPRELALGTWTFTVSAEGRVLYTAEFEIVAPGLAPNYAAFCTGNLMS